MNRSFIPNLLTLLNLLCGCIGIVMAFTENLEYSAILIWIAAVFDFFDGFAARALQAKSSIGKELDSLADMVSFGILPSSIMYILISTRSDSIFLPYLAFSLALFSAVRLAKFNIDEKQADTFIGLPTPANAFFISGLPFILKENFLGISDINYVAEILAGISIVFSVLLIVNLQMFSLKFSELSWEKNAIRYIFLGISLLLILLLKITAIPLIIIVYLAMSMISNLYSTTK